VWGDRKKKTVTHLGRAKSKEIDVATLYTDYKERKKKSRGMLEIRKFGTKKQGEQFYERTYSDMFSRRNRAIKATYLKNTERNTQKKTPKTLGTAEQEFW
jgi:hypothetical protein